MGRFLGGNQVAVVGYILEKRKNVKGWMDAAMDVHERASLDLYRYLIRLFSFLSAGGFVSHIVQVEHLTEYVAAMKRLSIENLFTSNPSRSSISPCDQVGLFQAVSEAAKRTTVFS